MFLNGKRRGRVNLKSDLERSQKNRVKERKGEGEGGRGRERGREMDKRGRKGN